MKGTQKKSIESTESSENQQKETHMFKKSLEIKRFYGILGETKKEVKNKKPNEIKGIN